MTQMALKGTITEWYIDKGYGYIIPDSGALRIKFLLSEVRNSVNIGAIKQPVRFVITQDEHGNRRATHIEGTRPFPWMLLIVVWFFATLAGCIYIWQYPVVVSYYYLATSSILIVVYWFDKRSEKRKKAVTGESALLFLSALGGWPGAAIGQYVFNLNAKSFVFHLLFVLIVIGHIAAIGWTLTPGGELYLEKWIN